MNNKQKRTISRLYAWLSCISITGLFFVCDQIAKYIARHHPTTEIGLGIPGIQLEYFENPGIAFSILLPTSLVLVITPIIVVSLIALVAKKYQKNKKVHVGSALVIFGALSNFIDRMLFGFTIDYIRIANAIINIADIMILVGGILLVYVFYRETTPTKEKTFIWEK